MLSSRLRLIGAAAVLTVFASGLLAGEPCCAIVGMNARGVVTAKEVATGRQFEFVVSDRAFLKALKVGQTLTLDARKNTVSLRNRQFKISKFLQVVQPAGVPNPTARSAGAGRYSVSLPDKQGFVTIRNTQTGKTTRYRASKKWLDVFASQLRTGGAQGQTEGGAEVEHQRHCDEVSTANNGGRPCIAECVMTTSGSDPTEVDDKYSCTCRCS